jgi:hypothetical protein
MRREGVQVSVMATAGEIAGEAMCSTVHNRPDVPTACRYITLLHRVATVVEAARRCEVVHNACSRPPVSPASAAIPRYRLACGQLRRLELPALSDDFVARVEA